MQKNAEVEAVPISIATGLTINLTKIYIENEHNFGDR